MNESIYDIIIIGGGTAGLTAAEFARKLDKRVAIVEAHRIGGDCTWTGCVPSKALLKAASVAHQMRNADRYGIPNIAPAVDLGEVMDRVKSVILDIYAEEKPDVLRAEGIDVYIGDAHFLDTNTIMAGDKRLVSRYFLIATGAKPYLPPVAGLEEVDYLTYETVWDLRELPERMLIVGAGSTGVEFAQAFQRLGSRVTLFEGQQRMLPIEDPEASVVLAKVFKSEGVNVQLDEIVNRVWQEESRIHLLSNGIEHTGDVLLMATGRRPNVAALGLERAGVEFTPDGIKVDQKLRTSNKYIFAAGDVTGGDQFTHYAGWQAAMAVRNAFLPGSSTGLRDLVPRTTFTDPEVAHIGILEQDARQLLGDQLRVFQWDLERVDRAHTDRSTDGFIKLLYKKDGTLTGTTIVAPHAGEMLHEWILAMQHGIKVGDLSNTIHVYPTYSMGNMRASAALRVENLMTGTSGRIIRGLSRLTERKIPAAGLKT